MVQQMCATWPAHSLQSSGVTSIYQRSADSIQTEEDHYVVENKHTGKFKMVSSSSENDRVDDNYVTVGLVSEGFFVWRNKLGKSLGV
jgi:hypothetical protein